MPSRTVPAEDNSFERALTRGETRPLDLDGYVDWAMDRACQGRMGRYQLMVLTMLGSMWTITSMLTYMLGFIATQPDIDAPSGRVLRLDAGDQCSPEQLATYGSSCPDLNTTMCGPEGRVNKTAYRDLWYYRDTQNSIRAEFGGSKCSTQSSWVTWVSMTFWWAFGIGVTVAGVVSDSRGRRFAWYMFLGFMVVGSMLVALSTDKWTFAAARLISAFGIGGFSMVGFVWSAESLNAECQHYMAWVPNFWFIIGACVPSVLTLATRNWRQSVWIYTAICIPWAFLCMPFYESPKWLAAKKKGRLTVQAMEGIARINGQKLSDRGLPPGMAKYKEKGDDESVSRTLSEQSGNPNESDDTDDTSKEDSSDESPKSEAPKENFLSLFNPAVLPRLVVTAAAWFVVSYSYYGLSLFAPPDLVVGRPVVAWCFSFALEFPAYVASGYLMKKPKIGRKKVTAGGITVGGIILVMVSLKPHFPKDVEWMVGTGLYYPARMAIAMGFAVIYPWSTELFPSSIRNSAMGFNSLFARLGASLAPMVGAIENFSLRMLLIGAPTAIVGIIAFICLPETIGRPLPGTIEDLD